MLTIMTNSDIHIIIIILSKRMNEKNGEGK
jgi:hypothetical protein